MIPTGTNWIELSVKFKLFFYCFEFDCERQKLVLIHYLSYNAQKGSCAVQVKYKNRSKIIVQVVQQVLDK